MSSLHSLTCIVSTSRDTLQSFRFSSSVEVNLDRYLATLPQLPKLRILEICSTNISWTFPTRNGIFDFIQKHSSQLEQLELLPTPPQNYPIGTSSQTEIFFFSPHHQPAISQIHFANVTSFHIGIPDRSRTWIRHENPLPPLASTMPNLTSLTLDTGFKLSFSALKDLIDGLPSQNGILGLRRLQFSCHTLDPQVLDTLASRLPSLQSLTINYQFLTMGSATDASPRPPQTADVIWLPFVMAMKTHKYTSWWINELRIARINPDSECSVPHPALPAMAAVASSLPLGRQIHLDRSYVCGCVPK
ncbi:hypothetical protein BJ165DRAFT_379257 [Panaeolus papilionaceus]|nr:hypothetical protein BJ165DRAFT_379257 [Panaeolus papilionaceus]